MNRNLSLFLILLLTLAVCLSGCAGIRRERQMDGSHGMPAPELQSPPRKTSTGLEFLRNGNSREAQKLEDEINGKFSS